MKPYFTYGAKASDRDLVTSTTVYSGQHKRYFSSLDAEIFIGGERILDIARIDFNYEEKKLPIYGFNSFIPSRIIVGQKLITGTFVIQFTETGYIAKLLDRIEESKIANQWDKVGISCDPNNAALFKKSFDILIGYGGYDVPEEFSYNATYQILQGVYINGYQQILDTSGEPVYEVYSFIARNLEFKKLGEAITVPDNNLSTDIGGKGKSIGPIVEDIELIESNNITEENYENSLIVDIKHIEKESFDSDIRVRFPQIIKGTTKATIESVRLTISDNQVNMSKSFMLNKYGFDWMISLNKSDTDKINKKVKTVGVNCLLEIEYKLSNTTGIKSLSKNVRMLAGN